MNNPFILLAYLLSYCFLIPILMISVIYKRYKDYKVRLFRKETFKLIKGEKVEKSLHNWYQRNFRGP